MIDDERINAAVAAALVRFAEVIKTRADEMVAEVIRSGVYLPPSLEGRKAHVLKTRTEYFNAIIDGRKTFEIRNNDRDFKPGDAIRLKEIDANEDATGRSCWRVISYISEYEQQAGFVVLGLHVPRDA
jgi:hypothetical protein